MGYYYGGHVSVQQPLYQYPAQNPQQIQHPGQPHQPPPGYNQFQQAPCSINQQSYPASQSQHHHSHHHHHKNSKSTISLPPIHTLNFHDDASHSSGESTQLHHSHRTHQKIPKSSSSSSESHDHHHSHKMTLPRIQDCLIKQNNECENRELPPIHTAYGSYQSGMSHSGTSNSTSPSSATSATSANSISSLSSAGSSVFVRSAKSESRSSSLSGILNSSPSSHSYDTTSSKNISNYSINHSGGYPLSSSPTSYYSSSSPYISDPYSSQSRNGAGTRYHQPMPNLSSKSQQDIYSRRQNMASASNNTGFSEYYGHHR